VYPHHELETKPRHICRVVVNVPACRTLSIARCPPCARHGGGFVALGRLPTVYAQRQMPRPCLCSMRRQLSLSAVCRRANTYTHHISKKSWTQQSTKKNLAPSLAPGCSDEWMTHSWRVRYAPVERKYAAHYRLDLLCHKVACAFLHVTLEDTLSFFVHFGERC
jgi:hypothetical protein